MTLKNNRAPFLWLIYFHASFPSHQWIQFWVTVQKRSDWTIHRAAWSQLTTWTRSICIYIYIYVHYRQKYGIFFISAMFCIFVECVGFFCTWNTFPRADITLGGVNLHLAAKWSAKFQKQLFRYFFSIRLWLEFLLSLCRLLPYPFVCCIEILCTIPLFIYHLYWCGQQEISVVGASHRRTGRVVLVYHKVMYTKS